MFRVANSLVSYMNTYIWLYFNCFVHHLVVQLCTKGTIYITIIIIIK